MRTLLSDAFQGGYAVSYCEAWNLESFQAVMQAAAELSAPVIAGFSGHFLQHSARKQPEELSYYAGMALALRDAQVPVSFLLNESESFSQISAAIDLGFSAVMVDNERFYCQLVRKVVALAHRKDVSVEAQIGSLPLGCDAQNGHGEITDPGLARRFVEETGVDALAVSVGNVHILTNGTRPVQLELLERIRAVVQVPLTVHGGTGFPLELIGAAIRGGIAKFNFGTVLKQAFLAAMRAKLEAYREPMNPHPFLGMGGPEDVLIAGREAMARKVKDILQRCFSVGKAEASNSMRTAI